MKPNIDFILLRPGQISREILDILEVLTETKKLPLEEARNIIKIQLDQNTYTYVGYVDGKPVCIGSFTILVKLGKNGSRSALIEDVVVKENLQGKGYGQKLVEFLKKKIISYKVYKIFLNCNNKNLPFYEKCGFYCGGNQMRIDID